MGHFATVRALLRPGSETPPCRWCGGATRLVGDAVVRWFPPVLETAYRCQECGELTERCRIVDPLD
jgi:hypothetical protein